MLGETTKWWSDTYRIHRLRTWFLFLIPEEFYLNMFARLPTFVSSAASHSSSTLFIRSDAELPYAAEKGSCSPSSAAWKLLSAGWARSLPLPLCFYSKSSTGSSEASKFSRLSSWWRVFCFLTLLWLIGALLTTLIGPSPSSTLLILSI